MRDQYERYTDKYLFEHSDDDRVKMLRSEQAKAEADRIIERFRTRPVYLKEVALKLAREVLTIENQDGITPDVL
jgi:hypothetical protein